MAGFAIGLKSFRDHLHFVNSFCFGDFRAKFFCGLFVGFQEYWVQQGRVNVGFEYIRDCVFSVQDSDFDSDEEDKRRDSTGIYQWHFLRLLKLDGHFYRHSLFDHAGGVFSGR